MNRTINSLKAYIKKELLEGVRTHKFLILGAAVLFFAILDPVMLKLMPEILKNQMQGIDFSALFDMNQEMAMTSFADDLYEIGTLIIVMTLMGIISGERRDRMLTIPVSSGCSTSGVLMSKIIVYGLFLTVACVAGMLIAYVYSGMIFSPDFAGYGVVIASGFLYGLFFIFVISVIALINSLSDKPFISGICTLSVVYLMPLLNHIKGAERFLPYYLVTAGRQFGLSFSGDLMVSLLCTLGIIGLLNVFAAFRLKNMEFV